MKIKPYSIYKSFKPLNFRGIHTISCVDGITPIMEKQDRLVSFEDIVEMRWVFEYIPADINY